MCLHSGWNYDDHFIMKELASKFKGQFECLGENREKYKTFSVDIENEIRKADKDGNGDIETVFYKVKCLDSSRFMERLLSYPVDSLAEGIHKIKCKDCNCF